MLLIQFMKRSAILLFLLVFPVIAMAQLYLYDTITCENIYSSPQLKECLKIAKNISAFSVSVGGNALWMAPSGNFSRHDNNTIWALGFAGSGFTLSIVTAFSMREAKMMLRTCGFGDIPGNELYRAVVRAQAMSACVTVIGFASTTLAIYGQYCQSDLVFGIGLGGVLASTFLSVFIPIMINDAIEIYNRGAPASLELSPTNDGIGMIFRF